MRIETAAKKMPPALDWPINSKVLYHMSRSGPVKAFRPLGDTSKKLGRPRGANTPISADYLHMWAGLHVAVDPRVAVSRLLSASGTRPVLHVLARPKGKFLRVRHTAGRTDDEAFFHFVASKLGKTPNAKGRVELTMADAGAFMRKMKDAGVVGVTYTNDFGDEIKWAKNRTCYILFDASKAPVLRRIPVATALEAMHKRGLLPEGAINEFAKLDGQNGKRPNPLRIGERWIKIQTARLLYHKRPTK